MYLFYLKNDQRWSHLVLSNPIVVLFLKSLSPSQIIWTLVCTCHFYLSFQIWPRNYIYTSKESFIAFFLLQFGSDTFWKGDSYFVAWRYILGWFQIELNQKFYDNFGLKRCIFLFLEGQASFLWNQISHILNSWEWHGMWRKVLKVHLRSAQRSL